MYIIAEIGFNHEGDLNTAQQMIAAAAGAGAQAVKFQTYRASDLALPSAAHYRAVQCGEMNLDQHRELARAAREHGIDFISTPFSRRAVDLLEQVGVPAYKVASMDCTNHQLLGHIARTQKPVYLSTGMATLAEIADALDFLKRHASGPVSLLHCIAAYPAAADDLNLDIIPYLKATFDIPVGYSDHYPGTAACLAAAMLGADIIETHFTLDSSRPGADHYHSAEPAELKKLIEHITLFQTMRGSRCALFNRPDRTYAGEYRRGLYAARALSENEVLHEDDVLACRPAAEFTPDDLVWLCGRRLGKAVKQHQALSREHV